MFAFGETVTVIRPAKRDPFGDTTAPPTSHTIDGCAINYQSTAEATDGRETILTWVELFCPVDADIESADKVTLPDGRTYLVDGARIDWRSPLSGWAPGSVVRLRGIF